jgi:hypothetical protein
MPVPQGVHPGDAMMWVGVTRERVMHVDAASLY